MNVGSYTYYCVATGLCTQAVKAIESSLSQGKYNQFKMDGVSLLTERATQIYNLMSIFKELSVKLRQVHNKDPHSCTPVREIRVLSLSCFNCSISKQLVGKRSKLILPRSGTTMDAISKL